MSIIGSIRKFFRLDKVTLSLDNEFIDATGLWIHEKNELMKEPAFGCFSGRYYSTVTHDPAPMDFHTDHSPHFVQDFHF